jgi:tetratricopeptide (TPR) repeat protein
MFATEGTRMLRRALATIQSTTQIFRSRPLHAFVVCLGCLVLAGCETAEQERLKQLNTDAMHRFNQGDYAGARESFEGALTLQPEDANLLYNIGQCFDRQGNTAEAERWYRQCLEKSDRQHECRHALIVLLNRTNRRDDGERMIQEWLAQDPNLPGPYAAEAWLLRQDRAYPQAQARLQQALNLDPHYVRALVELGILYEEMNLPERSLVIYERALAQNPNQPEITERLNSLRQSNVGRPKPTRDPGLATPNSN